MFADPKDVGLRKIRRHLKAGASIFLAAAAGVFLACQKQEPTSPTQGNPSGPDSRPGAGTIHDPIAAPHDAGLTQTSLRDAAVDAAKESVDAGSSASQDSGTHDAGASDAGIVKVDAGRDAGITRHHHRPPPRVDRTEHRTGMPVRDNLVE